MVFYTEQCGNGYFPGDEQRAKNKCGDQQGETANVVDMVLVVFLVAKTEKGRFHSISENYIHEWNGRVYKAHLPIYRSGQVIGQKRGEQVINKPRSNRADAVPCRLPREFFQRCQ